MIMILIAMLVAAFLIGVLVGGFTLLALGIRREETEHSIWRPVSARAADAARNAVGLRTQSACGIVQLSCAPSGIAAHVACPRSVPSAAGHRRITHQAGTTQAPPRTARSRAIAEPGAEDRAQDGPLS